ncbi:hypothetical protein [Prosthecodimorpha staleyi]|uniref:Uncharacterized protein n=1 Tax=Prosthecodimorpha staleyi TaxID=2840188 RepID=A0A947D1X0_9HYPH|nr:hypothetical protein [Prosthecodimorpha staleyi]MBT9288773.1 hypothetical protein [Prosthecodimorpha staleyi]
MTVVDTADCAGIVAVFRRSTFSGVASVSVTQRAYLKPGTTTGADPDVMVSPLVVF